MGKTLSEEVHLKYLRALRAGGFVCLLPQVIDPAWGGPAIRLAGFPITIRFTGLLLNPEQGEPSAMTSTYSFDPVTYFENQDLKGLTYYTNPLCDYSVELIFDKKNGRWGGRKVFGSKVILTAAGLELRRFMIQLTKRGIETDEPTEALQTLDGAGSGGAYVFVPNPPSAPESEAASESIDRER